MLRTALRYLSLLVIVGVAAPGLWAQDVLPVLKEQTTGGKAVRSGRVQHSAARLIPVDKEEGVAGKGTREGLPQDGVDLAAPSASATSDGGVRLRAVRVPSGGRPRIDGRLDEAAWQGAPRATGFIQEEPAAGSPASERTEVTVLYDATAIYVGFRCYVSDPSTLVGPLARRDNLPISDRVFVEIGSPADGRTAFSFGVNLAGVQQDVLLYNDENDGSFSWDAVWDSDVGRFSGPDGQGYTVELRIPFSQLRYDAASTAPWQIQFQRDIPVLGETAYWSPILPGQDGYISNFGLLDGLDNLRAPRRLEVLPYAAVRVERLPGEAENPFYAENDVQPVAGFDAKVGLTSNLTLTATVNPDFGQVEADPAVVNLSQFETFFEERRPFFVEGEDVFDFGRTRTFNVAFRPTFFYTRRIGRAPTRDPQEAVFLDSPEQTTIASAAKVSGQIGGWNVGLLDAVTVEETARYIDENGETLTTPVEPLSNFFVGRVRRDLRGGASGIGGIVMATNRFSDGDGLFDTLLPEQAYVGGLDFLHAWGGRKWAISGVLTGSYVAGDSLIISRLQRRPQRYYQRPDQDHLDLDTGAMSLSGAQAELSVAKTSGRVRGSLTGIGLTPGFEVNDLGFQRRADYAGLHWDVEYVNPRFAGLNYFTAYLFGGAASNFGGDLIQHYYRSGVFARFPNLWTLSINAGGQPQYVNDRLTRGGPLALRPADVSGNVSLTSDRQQRFWARTRVDFRRELPHSHRNVGVEWAQYLTLELTARPTNALEISLEPSYGTQKDTDQFFDRIPSGAATSTFGTRYVFADLRQESFDLGVRVNWTFSPDLTLQLYARPFVASGRYSGFRELAAPRTYDFTVYGQDGSTLTPQVRCVGDPAPCDYQPAPDGATPDRYLVQPGDGGDSFALFNDDFNFRSLRGNAVLRWEYRPGSTLFFVWQQTRDDFAAFDGFGVGEELGEVFRAPVQNVFLVKATYWLGL